MVIKSFTDPFSGKELIYRHDDAGFFIYSIGPNLVDDGGQEITDYAGDIAWSWGK